MKFVKILLAAMLVMFCMTSMAISSKIEVDTQYDFKLALDYVFTARVDTIVLITSGGIYTTSDTLPLTIIKPLTIVAAPGLAEKPIFTHCDPDSDVLDIFRICNDITIEGVVFDGGHPQSHGMKYALRLGHFPADDPIVYAKIGTNITVRNCDFKNIYQDKDLEKPGHAIYFLSPQETSHPIIQAGTVRIENCTFENIGDEAIRMSETEKYNIERCLDTLIVRNCTFSNIDAECIRFYADYDTSNNTDAYVLLEHITVNNSAAETIYIKRNKGTIVRDVIISNSRMAGADRADRNDFLINTQCRESFISHVDTFNITTLTGTKKGQEIYVSYVGGKGVDKSTIYGFDPLYEDPHGNNYTLLPASPAYGIAHDGEALGDLRWATNISTRLPFVLTINGNGSVTADPPLIAPNYEAGTNVTLTAVPDSGWEFVAWSGDLTGSNNPATITVDAAKNVTATFQQSTGIADATELPTEYRLEQNYPNPFNPSTTISFSLKKNGWTRLEIYNVIGQKIRTVLDQNLKAGNHQIRFDASPLPSGIYFYQIHSGEFKAVRKFVVMK